MKKIEIILIALLFITFGFFVANPVFADIDCRTRSQLDDQQGTGIFEGIGRCQECGDCSLCDFLTLATNLARWILSVMGGLAMIIFIWTGIGFIMSFGNAEKVEANKKAITGAVLGIVIIVGAWTLVNILFLSFISTNKAKGVANIWTDKPWSTLGDMCNPTK
jgi:hypothetical protein